MKELTLVKRVKISEQLTARILEDEGFKDDLLRDPRRVLANAFGLKLPDGIAVEVVADARDVKHVILPFDAETSERDDVHLEGEVEWYVELLDRVRRDEVFRHTLLKAPKAVLSEFLQIDLPESCDIRVLAETCERRYVLLPYLEDCYDSELNDETLELAVGGKSSSFTILEDRSGSLGNKVKNGAQGSSIASHSRRHRRVCR